MLKKEMISSFEALPISRQCELLDLARSSYYYTPKPESENNLRLMKMIDRQYLKTPFYGSRSMTELLKRQGEAINRKRVQRLMRIMGLEAMYPKPRPGTGNKEHYKYPYLLGNLRIERPNQVWGTDITYIPIEAGFLYLVVILDLFSRYVLAWVLSNNLETDFCIYAIEEALKTGTKPEIVNSDQGAQYTSKAWTDMLKRYDIAISMSGKGRCWDNIFVERLWRSLKYEEVYPKNYSTGTEARDGIGWYFNFYNTERLHMSLNYTTPRVVHYG
jgi:putative transposase